MTDAIIEFFSALPSELYVFVISLFPIIELRGAIPVGAIAGLPFYTNYIMAVLGNMLPVPFILLFISKFLDLLERFKLTRPLVNWVRRKADKHSSKVMVEDGCAVKNEAAQSAKEANLLSEEAKENGASPAQSIETTEDSATAQSIETTEDSVTAQSVEVAEDSATAQSIETTEDSVTAQSVEAAEDSTTAQNVEVAEDSVTAQSVEVAEDSAAESKKLLDSQRKMTPAIFTALTLFVAIPLPGTGAWTGSLIASLFNLPKKLSLLSVFIGVLLSGVIMCLASYGVVGFLSFIL